MTKKRFPPPHQFLPPEQEAFLGCGTHYLIDCDVNGFDLANADAGVLMQSFPWFEGTKFNPHWDTSDPTLPQPGTVGAAFNDGPGGGVDAPDSRPGEVETGPAGSRFEGKTAYVLPGAHYDPVAFADVLTNAAANGITVDPFVLANLDGYDIAVDGAVCPGGVCRTHPFTGQRWSSEMAIVSWNLLMLAVGLGAQDNATNLAVLDRANPLALGRCSYRQPQYCTFVSGFASQARNTSSSIRAGGRLSTSSSIASPSVASASSASVTPAGPPNAAATAERGVRLRSRTSRGSTSARRSNSRFQPKVRCAMRSLRKAARRFSAARSRDARSASSVASRARAALASASRRAISALRAAASEPLRRYEPTLQALSASAAAPRGGDAAQRPQVEERPAGEVGRLPAHATSRQAAPTSGARAETIRQK